MTDRDVEPAYPYPSRNKDRSARRIVIRGGRSLRRIRLSLRRPGYRSIETTRARPDPTEGNCKPSDRYPNRNIDPL